MFTLSFDATIGDVLGIKNGLRNKFPEVKSSHLTEGIARGLGFNSHVALINKIGGSDKAAIAADGQAFCDFLNPKHYSVTGASFYIAVAQVAVKIILRNNVKIGSHGYGYGPSKRKSDGSRENAKERYSRFLTERSELESKHSALGFLRSLVLLQQVKKIKTISAGMSSYGIKHIAEKLKCSFPTGEELGPDYVSNAQLILAALHLDLRFKSYIDNGGYDSPNLCFNLSSRSLSDLDCLVRPDGARAQDRKRRLERDDLTKYVLRKIKQHKTVISHELT